MILNELNYVPKEVVGLITDIQLNLTVVDYILKKNIIDHIYNSYGQLVDYSEDDDSEDSNEDKNENKLENLLLALLLTYNIDMKQLNDEFYKKYGDLYEELQ